MPGSSPDRGLPYSVDSDPLSTVAATMQALAIDAERMVQARGTLVATPGGGAVGSQAVTFDHPYATPPIVIAQHPSAGGTFLGYPSAVTATGFTANIVKSSAGASSTIRMWVAGCVPA
jgi:hypothetical protein